MDPTTLQQLLMTAFQFFKCLQIGFQVFLLIHSLYGMFRSLSFVKILIISAFYVLEVCCFPLTIRYNFVNEEGALLLGFIGLYGVSMVAIYPYSKSYNMRGNAIEFINHGEDDNVQDPRQKDEENFSCSIINKTSEVRNLWGTTSNLSSNVIKYNTDSFFKMNMSDPQFISVYNTTLIIFVLILIFQAVIWFLAWMIDRQPVQELDANAAPQNEVVILLQPVSSMNEIFELEQDSGEGSSTEQSQTLQNFLTHRGQ